MVGKVSCAHIHSAASHTPRYLHESTHNIHACNVPGVSSVVGALTYARRVASSQLFHRATGTRNGRRSATCTFALGCAFSAVLSHIASDSRRARRRWLDGVSKLCCLTSVRPLGLNDLQNYKRHVLCGACTRLLLPISLQRYMQPALI